MTADYRLARVLPRNVRWGGGDSAVWSIAGLRGALVARGAQGWYLQVSRPPILPEWLAAQMRPRGSVYYWTRGVFATRQDLLEALRAEEERAENSATSAALAQVLA